MSNASITMYSTQWCGYCHRLRTALKSAGIAYDEVDIEQDPAAADFVGSVNGGNHVVPTLKFADGSTLTNPGANEVKARLAKLAGYGRAKSAGFGPGFDDHPRDRHRSG